MLLCLLRGVSPSNPIRGGTPPSPDVGGTPIPSPPGDTPVQSQMGVPHPVPTGGTSSSLNWGYPIQSQWGGSPGNPHPDLGHDLYGGGGGGYPHLFHYGQFHLFCENPDRTNVLRSSALKFSSCKIFWWLPKSVSNASNVRTATFVK